MTIDSAGAAPDKRRQDRHRVLLAGKISHGAGVFTSDCTMRDRSDDGARLRLPSDAALPKGFYLIDMQDGIAHECEMVWRKGRELGVHFTRAIALDPLADPQFGFLRRLYVEGRPR